MERASFLGFDAIEINHSMDHTHVAAIRSQLSVAGSLPVSGVHAPAPLDRDPSGRWNRDLNLAATNEAERELAVSFVRSSIALASDIGARYVIVHLGEVGEGELKGEQALRRLYERGETSGAEWDRANSDAVESRAILAPRYLIQARRSLYDLALTADKSNVTLGLECRLHYHQIPLPGEAVDLLADYRYETVGYCHDVGHAEVLNRLGMVPLASWFHQLGDRLVCSHMHDVLGIRDHRAPGNGDVDFAALASLIPPGAGRTLEIDEQESDDEVARGLALLREIGVVG